MAQTVLVVDDDEQFRSLARRLLQSCGYEANGEAGGFADALRCADELRPDAALVDIGLPDGDGMDLSRRLAALPWHVRVVLISSDSDASTAECAAAVGATAFVPKSDLSGQLLRTLIGEG